MGENPNIVAALRARRNIWRLACGGTTAALALGSTPVWAQEQPNAVEGAEIVVTAQRREQSLLDVPAAVSAFSGDKLQQLGVKNLPELTTQVPNFRVTYERGPNSIANFTLRGVRGAALASRLNESSVSVYFDDVFVGDETAVNASLFDVERVEVLRGPQGTVFGKNTTGGLVSFISAKPTADFSGHASTQYGSDNQIVFEGAVSGPIGNSVRVRLAGKVERDDGHYRNRFLAAGTNGIERKVGDKDVWGFRGIIDADLSENTLLRVIGSYSEDNSEPTPGTTYGALLPGTTGAGPYTRARLCTGARIISRADCISDVQATRPSAILPIGRKVGTGVTNLTPDDMGIRGRGRSITGQLTHDFDWATLTSITNYTRNNYQVAFDADAGAQLDSFLGGASFDFIQILSNKAKQFSQELRLNGSTDGFDWVTGLYYYSDEKSSIQQTNLRSRGFSLFNTGALDTTSYAAFAQIDAHLSDKVTMTIGGRYTDEQRDLTDGTTVGLLNATGGTLLPFQDVRAGLIARGLPVKARNKDFTGKFSMTWEPNDDSTYYASYSRGIKGAGFNTGFSPASTLTQNIALTGPVGQEILDSLEIGAKNRLFGRLLSVNTAAFYYDYKGKQEQVFSFDPVTSSVAQNYLNAGTAEIYGIETEILLRPTPRLDISFTGGLIHARIRKSDIVLTDTFNARIPLQGLRLSDVPDWSFNAYVAYRVPVARLGTFTIQPEFRGVDKTNYSLTNDPVVFDEAHVFTNLRVLWESEDRKFNGQVFVTNLFNTLSLLNPRDVVLGSAGKFNVTEGQRRLWGVQAGMKF